MTPDNRQTLTYRGDDGHDFRGFFYGEVAPWMSRCYLLDKYKFLMLSALKYRKEPGEDDITRARFHNFKFLKAVAARKKPSFGEIQQLLALRSFSNYQNLPLNPSTFTTPLQLQNGQSYVDQS
jgi:hypothetical protein